MNQPSDDTIRLCQAGDAEAFCELVGLYEKPLHGYVYRMLWNSQHAQEVEDVVQEVFLKAYSHIGSFRSTAGAFSTWLFGIARNHCISLHRKRRIPIASCDEDEEILDGLADEKSVNPRQAATAGETARGVALAIARLPEDQKSALLLRCYEEMSYDEIAQVLGCTTGTAKSRVRRAREKLAVEVGELL